jgi:tRNA(Ile)-lysidine synthase
MQTIEQTLFTFLDRVYDSSRPVLLALSGGADSLSLFYLLLKYKKKLTFAVAHVDHGWREESAKEARVLLELATTHQIPFHLKTIDPTELKGNLEAACRHERLTFFNELCQSYNYQAVLLGHHADDQVETVLKKIFEGHSLPYLSSLREMTTFQGLTLWRPLLNIEKEQIRSWLQTQQITPFEDRTNSDPKFLRARFRTQIIPNLSATFGKEIKGPLRRIAKESEELDIYMEQQLSPYLNQIKQGRDGLWLDLSVKSPSSTFELKYLVRRFCEKNNAYLSYTLIEKVADLMMSNAADRQISMGEIQIFIDRKRLFASKQAHSESNSAPLELERGSYTYNNWLISVEETVQREKALTGWQAAWQGQLCISLPKDSYSLNRAKTSAPYRSESSTLDKWWTDHKVPAFLRARVPVIMVGNRIVHEFLSGKAKIQDENCNEWIKIALKRK